MSETQTPATQTPAKAKSADGPKSLSIALVDGAGSIQRVIAVRRKQGDANMYVNVVSKGADGKPVTKRSGTKSYPSMDAAKAAIEAHAERQVALNGWTRRAGGGAIRARAADFDFDSVPKGKPAAKK